MVDRVELAVVDQVLHVRRLDDGDAVVLQQRRDARDDAVEVGDVGQHVVGVNDVGALAVRRELLRRAPCRRTRRWCGCPAPPADLRDVARRLDAEHRARPRSRSTGAGSRRCWRSRRRGCPGRACARRRAASAIVLRVLQHRVGERREVEVVAEQRLRRHRLGDLDERAVRAERRDRAETSAPAAPSCSSVSSALASGVVPEREDERARSAAPHDAARVVSVMSACLPRNVAVPRDRALRGPRRA